MEAAGGFEPLNRGFADLSLNHLGTPPLIGQTWHETAGTTRLARPLRGFNYALPHEPLRDSAGRRVARTIALPANENPLSRPRR